MLQKHCCGGVERVRSPEELQSRPVPNTFRARRRLQAVPTMQTFLSLAYDHGAFELRDGWFSPLEG